jgi:hypothetical protein
MAEPRRPLSNLVRLAPLRLEDLPAHPDLLDTADTRTNRPDLATFVARVLDDGAAFLEPKEFGRTFKHQSTKSAPPAAAKVEVLTRNIEARDIEKVEWTNAGVGRRSQPETTGEYWVARKSIHRDVSSKSPAEPGSASWDEFVFGLRDDHSQHECDFTPTLYDARRVLEWEGPGLFAETRYSSVTAGVFEMCHAIPPPLQPRCFSVLVVTAGLDPDSFVAVTVPVHLAVDGGGGPGFYSTGRNVREGETAQRRKRVCMGVYAAVETVRRDPSAGAVEWTMATASDAKGHLPFWVQKMSVPGAVVKDVGLFMKWIRTVDVDAERAKKGRQTP